MCACVRHRDVLAFDGGITNFIPVPPNCPGAVRVACFPSEQLKAFRGIGMSPDTFESWCADGERVKSRRTPCGGCRYWRQSQLCVWLSGGPVASHLVSFLLR